VAVREDLIEAIEAIVDAAASIGYAAPGATNDVYENYVWSLCVVAAQQQGATVSYQTVTGQTPTVLRFRTSPGDIYSQAHPYTHALISFPGCPLLEAHVGIRVIGKSRVLHECDVAVLHRDEAELCRLEAVHPRASKVVIAAECKFFTSALQLHLGRGFLGLISEIHRRERYLVTNSQSASVRKLISHHQSEWEFGVLPNNPQANALQSRFARTFRNFTAAY